MKKKTLMPISPVKFVSAQPGTSLKKIVLTLLLSLVACTIYAQVVINKYAAVLAYDPCKNNITVDLATDFGIGDTILLIQMKGATIDTTNTAAFGSVLNYNGAGNYELNTIESKVGNVLTLHYVMARNYDIPNGKVQIVRVPYYQNYTISQPHTCLQWDGNKGGVFMINVANTLTMNDSISVSNKGFRGGIALLSTISNTCNETNYFYDAASNKGANKGEGIADIGIDKTYGKGSLANGGGGGNAHNAGGGGGSNGGVGGQGGNQYPHCPPVAPGTNGLGGIGLNYSNVQNKVFLGGGGGAGHGNDLSDKPGGAGGGIAIIWANTLVGNAKAINANGETPFDCGGPFVSCANDGGSAGGAGGTVILKVSNYTGSSPVNAKGGKGADFWYNPPNAALEAGPGGGGGGGIAWFSQTVAPPAVTNTLTGGANGVDPQFANNNNGAAPGNNGQTLNSLVFNFPTDTFAITFNFNVTETTTACNTLQFSNTSTGTPPIISWFWDFGNGTSTLQNPTHTFPAAGTYTVTLVATDSIGCTDTFSHTVTVISNINYSILDSSLSCTAVRLTANYISGNTATQYTWLFGDNSPSGSSNTVMHTYPQSGTYNVTLIVNDGLGCVDTITKAITLTGGLNYTITDVALNCKTVELSAQWLSGDTATNFLWIFSDNTTATGTPVTHIYSQNGTYTVALVVSNSLGCLDTFHYTFTLPVDIHYSITDSGIDCKTAKLTASYLTGDTASGLLWLFPDGDTASSNPVVHTFPNTGANTAGLVMINSLGCRDTMSYSFTILYQLFADFTFTPDPPEKNKPLQFHNASSPAAVKFSWDFGDSTHSAEENPLKLYDRAGVHKVCLTATDSNDCSATACKDILADVTEIIDIPDAFSPNGDGINDVLFARGFGVASMTLTVYNRWGQKIFTSTGLEVGWDGSYKSKPQPNEAYAYILDAVFVSGRTFHKQGNVSILR